MTQECTSDVALRIEIDQLMIYCTKTSKLRTCWETRSVRLFTRKEPWICRYNFCGALNSSAGRKNDIEKLIHSLRLELDRIQFTSYPKNILYLRAFKGQTLVKLENFMLLNSHYSRYFFNYPILIGKNLRAASCQKISEDAVRTLISHNN